MSEASTLWRRLRHTPICDILRGRLTGRIDVKRIIADAELPAVLSDLIANVVRRTRLWPVERADLASELCAHFQDGLESGAAPETLADAFGDAAQAARLIRRAKLRCRPLRWRAFRAFRRLCAGLFVIYIILLIRIQTGEPVISRSFVEEINAASRAAPEGQRAWPIYREAYSCGDKLPGHGLSSLIPDSPEWRDYVEYINSHPKELELYRTAASMPHMGKVLGENQDLQNQPRSQIEAKLDEPPARNMNAVTVISIVLPELTLLRDAARLILADAYIAAEGGDASRVMNDLDAALGICNHAGETPFLIGDIVSIAVADMQTSAVLRLLNAYPELFTNQHLQHLSHKLVGIRGGGDLYVDFTGERWAFEDVIQRMYTDDGDGNGHLTAKGRNFIMSISDGDGASVTQLALFDGVAGFALLPVADMVIADRREIMRKYDEIYNMIEADARTPLWRRGPSQADAVLNNLRSSWFEQMRYLPVAVLMPNLSRSSVLAETASLKRDATCAVLACELFRRNEGRWPDGWDELTPRYLPVTPIDRFDGAPLRYRLIDGAPRIYSVGADLMDDGGGAPATPEQRRRVRNWRPKFSTDSSISPQTAEEWGDWVFWPPVE